MGTASATATATVTAASQKEEEKKSNVKCYIAVQYVRNSLYVMGFMKLTSQVEQSGSSTSPTTAATSFFGNFVHLISHF